MIKVSSIIIFAFLLIDTGNAQNQWNKKALFPGLRYGAVAFNIADYGYAGTGSTGSRLCNDLWRYDPITDTWEEVEKMPAPARLAAFAFVIEGKAYVGGGFTQDTDLYDLWQYDPQLNKWTRKGDVPQLNFGDYNKSSFSIGNKGYLLATFNDNNFYEYNSDSDSWRQLANFPGQGGTGQVLGQVGFVIGTKGYIGTGSGAKGYSTEFWEYDAKLNMWTQKAIFGGQPRSNAVGFSIHNSGFIGIGVASGKYLKDFWEYHPDSDTWTPIADCGYSASNAFAMTIGNKGYVGTGVDFSFSHNFWEYTPDLSSSYLVEHSDCIRVYPNPANDKLFLGITELGPACFTILTLSGQLVKNGATHDKTIPLSDLQEGVYFLKVITRNKLFSQKFFKE